MEENRKYGWFPILCKVSAQIKTNTYFKVMYFSELTKEKVWDHKKFSEIIQRLEECNYVKYSMYRVALKIRVLQNSLFSKYSLLLSTVCVQFSILFWYRIIQYLCKDQECYRIFY